MHADDTFCFRRRRRLSRKLVEGVGCRILSDRLPRSQRSSRRVCTVLPQSEPIPRTQWAHAVDAPPQPTFRPENRAFSWLRAALQGPELEVAEPLGKPILPLRERPHLISGKRAFTGTLTTALELDIARCRSWNGAAGRVGCRNERSRCFT